MRPLVAIKAHRIAPNEPAEASVRPYKPSLRVVAKPILESCTACNENAAYAIPDACRMAIRNMRPLPCESVLSDELHHYRHDCQSMTGFVAPPSAPTQIPVDANMRREAPVMRDILDYMAQVGPTDGADICHNLPQYEYRIVSNVLLYMAKRGIVFRAKPLVSQRYRSATYSLVPIRFEMTVRTHGMSDRDREIVIMRVQGATIDAIIEKYRIGRETVGAILKKGITECLVTDDTES